MQILIDMLKILASCIPMVLLLKAVSKINLKRTTRAYQLFMPVAAVVYTLIVCLVLVWLNNKFQVTVNYQNGTTEEVGFIRFWLGYSTGAKVSAIQIALEPYLTRTQKLVNHYGGQLPVDSLETLLQSVLFTLGSYLNQYAESILKYLMIAASTLLVFGYMIFKTLMLPVMKLLAKTGSPYGICYAQDEETKFFMLAEEYKDFRKLQKALYLGSCVVGILLSVCGAEFSSAAAFKVVLFPLCAALITGEIYFFLGGYTRTEYNDDILGDDSNSAHLINLVKLRETFKSFFQDRLLVEGSEIASATRQSVTDLLEDMNVSENTKERVSAKYFEILQNDGVELNVDNIRSATRILKGDNVLFYNPFYKDLTPYLMLPVTDALMNRRKVLVIAGRKSTENEIVQWLRDALMDHLKMSGMWRVDLVGSEEEYEIGVLPFSQLYNLEMITEEKEFFRETGLVIMLEPSLVLATGQIGLNLVVNYCEEGLDRTIYCLCDRNCDGLVDSMSHVIKQSIVTVAATEAPVSAHTEMCWNADGEYLQGRVLPDVTRYLGVGTELSVVAAREQVPHISWHSENKFPVAEMHWIAGQYYDKIAHFANMPMNQQSLDDTISFVPDLWGTEKEPYKCMIVEDEFCNLLEMVRTFLTRGTEQTMVNILSENYLLRDYMQYNYRIFAADRKAIPTIVADYAHSRRNTTFRLLLMLLTNESVPESVVRKELRLAGLSTDNPRAMLNRMITHYCNVGAGTFVHSMLETENALEFDYNLENYLYINKEKQEELKNKVKGSFYTAYYVMEDDVEKSNFMDAKLFGHIFQAILPGQFFTYDGKYYEVRSITTEKGVVVRRAADHIEGRKYYRQKRHYSLEGLGEASNIREENGIKIETLASDITVETKSYLELNESNNIKTAREITVPVKPGKENPYTRNYRRKNVLRISLPGMEEEMRYTLCLLLTEIFKTVYADAWPYLAVTTSQTEKTKEALRGILYTLDVEKKGEETDENASSETEDCIYIIEDSDVDMGLLESVDRNLGRILKILSDFLNWHDEKIHEVEPEEPEEEVEITIELPEEEEKKGFFARIASWFRRLFRKIGNFFRKLFKKPLKPYPPEKNEKEKRKAAKAAAEAAAKKAAEEATSAETEAEAVEMAEVPEVAEASETMDAVEATENIETEAISETVEEAEVADAEEAIDAEETADSDDPDEPIISKSIMAGDDALIDGDDAIVIQTGEPVKKNHYALHNFLLYGYDEIDTVLQLDGLRVYLNQQGFDDNELMHIRKGIEKPQADNRQGTEQICDFCQKPLGGVSYDVLNDGRVRCSTCSASAIETVGQFRALYKRILPTMEAFYNVRINVPVRVRMTDAKTIAKKSDSIYEPSTRFDPRTLGFASYGKDGYALYVENGSPRLATIETVSHELTHIWQFRNWDRNAMIAQYGKGLALDIVYEGMAMWASIQFLYLIGETDFARAKEEQTLRRDDAYGKGFELYCKKYPLSRTSTVPARTPFHSDKPL